MKFAINIHRTGGEIPKLGTRLPTEDRLLKSYGEVQIFDDEETAQQCADLQAQNPPGFLPKTYTVVPVDEQGKRLPVSLAHEFDNCNWLSEDKAR